MRPGHGPCSFATGESQKRKKREPFKPFIYPDAEYVWDERRLWWPHRCVFTGKWLLPFTKVVKGRIKAFNGPTSVLYLTYVALWTTPAELVIQKLKGNI